MKVLKTNGLFRFILTLICFATFTEQILAWGPTTAGGTFTDFKTVTIDCHNLSWKSDRLLYSTNGTIPGPPRLGPRSKSNRYTAQYVIDCMGSHNRTFTTTTTLKHRFERKSTSGGDENPRTDYYYSAVASDTYTIKLSSPVFSIPNNTTDPASHLTLTAYTGTTIHYNINGGAYQNYTSSIPITKNSYICAYATKTNTIDSQTECRQYYKSQAAPVFSPIEETHMDESQISFQDVNLSGSYYVNSVGSRIYYEIGYNGDLPSNPTDSSTLYNGPFQLLEHATIKAVAIHPNNDYLTSSYTTKNYVIKASPPSFSPPGNEYLDYKKVTLTNTRPGTTIRYTLTEDGDPTVSGMEIDRGESIYITKTSTLKAVTLRNGEPRSDVISASYIIKLPTPVFSPTPSNIPFGIPIDVEVNSSCSEITAYESCGEASFHYTTTTDGSDPPEPTESDDSVMDGDFISLDQNTRIKIKAFHPDNLPSDSTPGTFEFKPPPPFYSINGGIFDQPLSVTLYSAKPGSTIFYTIDDSDPIQDGIEISSGESITVDCNMNLQAIAKFEGWHDSDVTIARFDFSFGNTIGQEIKPPESADTSKKPTIYDDSSPDAKDFDSKNFYWSEDYNKLYAIGEVNGREIIWTEKDTNRPLKVMASNTYPLEPELQIHVAGSEQVYLQPDKYEHIKKVYATSDNTVITNDMYFSSSSPGYTVILLQQTGEEPDFKVIRSDYWYRLNGPDIAWDIGDVINDPSHDAECGGGLVFNSEAPFAMQERTYPPFDGYNREERSGPIVPIKPDDMDEITNDLTVIWYNKDDFGVCWPSIPKRYIPEWPDDPQLHVINTPPVQLHTGHRMKYNTPEGSSISDDGIFTRNKTGYTVLSLAYDDMPGNKAVFSVIQSIDWNENKWSFDQSGNRDESMVEKWKSETMVDIGSRIIPSEDISHDVDCGGGFIINEVSSWAKNTEAAEPYNGYDRDTRSGPIFAVNTDYDISNDDDNLVVVWYQKDDQGLVCWPYHPTDYTPAWPVSPDKIIIASMEGTGELEMSVYRNPMVYEQENASETGFNPNEEHAHVPSNVMYAQRDDLNDLHNQSEPYSLLMYQNPLENNEWSMKVYRIVREEAPYFLNYVARAGSEIQPPRPLDTPDVCPENKFDTGPGKSPKYAVWEDLKDKLYAKSAGLNNGPVNIIANFYERWRDEECTPWLDGGTGKPVNVTYNVYWPDDDFWDTYSGVEKEVVPEMQIGQTLLRATNGLPDITTQCSVEIITDQAEEISIVNSDSPTKHSVQLIKYNAEISVPLDILPVDIKTENTTNGVKFIDLPYHLQMRIFYNLNKHQLVFKGVKYTSKDGQDVLLVNIMNKTEKDQIISLNESRNQEYRTAVEALFHLTHETAQENSKKLVKGDSSNDDSDNDDSGNMLSAGSATGAGYVTLALQADKTCVAKNEVISLKVIKVVNEMYAGKTKVIDNESNVFDERTTLRHDSDFMGEPELLLFQWMYAFLDENGKCPNPPTDDPPGHPWIPLYITDGHGSWEDGYLGANDVTIGGSNTLTLKDKCLIVRYKGYDTAIVGDGWSDWTDSQLSEGWLKRVTKKLNPYNARIDNFHTTEVNTTASMIMQAGKRYVGDVAMNADPDHTEEVGLIELYETVLRRAISLSINGVPALSNDSDINQALLFSSGRIADLYMLLGNEAYADAADPTIAFGTEDGQYGSEAASIFAFQNQTANLLEEELALLRGRDDYSTSTKEDGVYNRLVWNYTSGIEGGEVAYSLNYNLEDQDGKNGITVADAKIMFPQSHGDAWGHYLMAVKTYYKLLRHPRYEWEARPESVFVAGMPVQVDYYDERKFARAAAAKARTGAEITHLTFLDSYSADPLKQWQGYTDSDTERSWGVSEWATRSGQGAYFDWVTANRLLPETDVDSTGDLNLSDITRIDRSTVPELREIAASYTQIQAHMDKVDNGLNPLGLAKDAIPFDIDPSEVDSGNTHFEQIYQRAVQAVNNAIVVFNHANQSSQLLRRQQDSLSEFKDNVDNREADFNSRLIEIFGTPYSDDIGPGKTYPQGYNGPDLINYMYVDVSELMGVNPPTTREFHVTIKSLEVGENGGLYEESKDVVFHLSNQGFGLIKPESWIGRRSVPGEIQLARSDLLQAKARFERGLIDYNNLLANIETQARLLETQYNVNTEEIEIMVQGMEQQQTLNSAIKQARTRQISLRTKGRAATLIANALAEALPSVSGVIGGMAAGYISDFTAMARSAIRTAGAIKSEAMNKAADQVSLLELDHQQAKEMVSALNNIELKSLHNDFAIQQQLAALEQQIRTEAVLRIELYTLQENMQQIQGRYIASLAKGVRIQEDRLRFRKQTAANIQGYRYKDMAFRIFRNDALQKYRAQFDMAVLYTYLAAKAYDYETNLLVSNDLLGENFLTDILKKRTIGIVSSGQPMTGSGLADPLKRMSVNFQWLKGQLGFNNPQVETSKFSLRKELFRIQQSSGSNESWRAKLKEYYVSNLWDIPEFRRYAIPFNTNENVVQPGLVIDFSTNITSGLNLFNWPLGGGDSYYSAADFATRIRSVGVWFSNYNNIYGYGMSETPNVYLIPTGMDTMRSPYSSMQGAIRNWQVVDQILPLPFPISNVNSESTWIPTADTVFGEYAKIRRHSDFRAFHDSGNISMSEMAYDSRLIGRSVWNSNWLLIIPGVNLHGDAEEGLATFIDGPKLTGSDERTGEGVTDISIFFETYAYSGE